MIVTSSLNSIPPWMYADELEMAETYGWVNFSKPGDFTIMAYLVEGVTVG